MSVMRDQTPARFKVAIIGCGPGGLATAIELSYLPFVDWHLYEKKDQISETGGGISIQPSAWKLLFRNGTAEQIREHDMYRHSDGLWEQRRNGRTGELLMEKRWPDTIPPKEQSARMIRARLQKALLDAVEPRNISVKSKLCGIQNAPGGKIRIVFENGLEDVVDLVVGADGIRSVVRQSCLPSYSLSYTGQKVFRSIVSKTKAMQIRGIPFAPVFWKHTSGTYVYTCPLGNDDFEVTVRLRPLSTEVEDPVSWGLPADLRTILRACKDFCPAVQSVLLLAADSQTQEFAMFRGPRLESMTFDGNRVLVGDAAHQMLGNFGNGAGFAFEDAYTLARSLQWAWSGSKAISDALVMFDALRSPHYERLYVTLDEFAAIKQDLRRLSLPVDEDIEERVKRIGEASQQWMLTHDVEKAIECTLPVRSQQLEGAGQRYDEAISMVFP